MRGSRKLVWFLTAASLSLVFAMRSIADDQPAAEPGAPGFFRKYLDCGGIPVRASASVADEALRLACDKVTMMLQNVPSVRDALVRRGAELHIIGRNEQTSDLPEFRDQRGKLYVDNRGRLTTIDERTRGKGGLLSSCGEENILHLLGDRYGDGSDVCIHEFAHAIMDYGLDAAQRRRINDRFAAAMASGLWRNAYAATNAKEYWAELSMWYFGSHGARRRVAETPAGNGPAALQAYDPEGYDLLQSIYGRPP